MALFSTQKNKTAKQSPKTSSARAAKKSADGREHVVIRAPWLSEKALIGTENGIYVFQVPANATKPQVAAAIQTIYGVTPRQVRMVNLPAKRKALRTRRGFGVRAARHKAYVYLNKGETIQFA